MNKQVPTIIKIISIIFYIGAVVGILTGITILYDRSIITDLMPELAEASGAAIIAIGAFAIIAGIVNAFTGRGLWKLKNWARILAMIIAIIGVVQNIVPVFAGNLSAIFVIAVDILIVYVLGFKEDVKILFFK